MVERVETRKKQTDRKTVGILHGWSDTTQTFAASWSTAMEFNRWRAADGKTLMNAEIGPEYVRNLFFPAGPSRLTLVPGDV